MNAGNMVLPVGRTIAAKTSATLITTHILF
jgi:hypothetical protein